MKKITKVLTLSALIGSLSLGTMVSAASSGKTYINNTYGYLNGETYGYINMDSKWFETNASTTRSVPRLRVSLEVQYYSTGTSIQSRQLEWSYNTSFVGDNMDMIHFKNRQTNKYDGFLNTKVRSYGTADAITSKPYVVYTSYVY